MKLQGYVLQGQKTARKGITYLEIVEGAGFKNNPYTFNDDYVPVCETQLTIHVAQYLKVLTLKKRIKAVWFHVPNGGQRAAKTGGDLKKMGTLAGIADFAFMWGNGAGFIELKHGKGTQQPTQVAIQHWAEDLGVNYAICKSPQEVLDVLKKWGVLI